MAAASLVPSIEAEEGEAGSDVSPPASARALEVECCSLEGAEEEGAGGGEEVGAGPAAGAQLGEQAGPLGSAEEDSSCSQTLQHEEGGPGEPCGSLEDSCGPEPACLPPAAEEEQAWLVPARVEEDTCGTEGGPLAPDERASLLEDSDPGRGGREPVPESCCIQAEDASGDEQECPICTEPYDRDRHRPALLNCSHVLCGQCLHAIMEAASAADIGRVRCPICRQKTPMMEWEICKLQEELFLLGSEAGQASPPPPAFNAPLARRPGLWGRLEHHFQVRFHTSRMVGFLPCLRYPPSFISGLGRLERRCRWVYLLALLALLLAELLSLLLIFLPIVLLLFLFLILEK